MLRLIQAISTWRNHSLMTRLWMNRLWFWRINRNILVSPRFRLHLPMTWIQRLVTATRLGLGDCLGMRSQQIQRMEINHRNLRLILLRKPRHRLTSRILHRLPHLLQRIDGIMIKVGSLERNLCSYRQHLCQHLTPANCPVPLNFNDYKIL